MISKVLPSQFKEISWKNGKGNTLELASDIKANSGNYTWRVSIATVAENGNFSDFSGFTRAQVLLSGDGIVLMHNESKIQTLLHNLDHAIYDGSFKTSSKLITNEVQLFNVFAKSEMYSLKVQCYKEDIELRTSNNSLNFIYSYKNDVHMKSERSFLLKNHLLISENESLTFIGKNIIHIELKNMQKA